MYALDTIVVCINRWTCVNVHLLKTLLSNFNKCKIGRLHIQFSSIYIEAWLYTYHITWRKLYLENVYKKRERRMTVTPSIIIWPVPNRMTFMFFPLGTWVYQIDGYRFIHVIWCRAYVHSGNVKCSCNQYPRNRGSYMCILQLKRFQISLLPTSFLVQEINKRLAIFNLLWCI